ncbi:MAG: hypothetical protein ABSA02_40615 [Trebonia sp.]|jgi:hypothetical protein
MAAAVALSWLAARLAICRLLHPDGRFVVTDLLVPTAERRPGGVLDHGLLVIVPGEVADRLQIREPG